MEINKQILAGHERYRKYLISKPWTKLRDMRIKKDNGVCVLCKSNKKLICHHLTYKRLFNEDINDLITLCKRCHSRIEFICPPKDAPNFITKDYLNYAMEFSCEDQRSLIEDDE